ncbi:MAG: Threonine synthase, partial [uncultured Corynebacteriales bacterium]
GDARARLARPHRGVPGPAAGAPGDARGDPAGGGHATAAGAGAVRPHRLRGVAQGRGAEPDRVVQGPRDDGGDHPGPGGREQGGHLREHGQHLGLRGGVRGAGRPDLRGPGAGGQDRAGQAGPGAGARGQAAAGRRQLRRLPHRRPGAVRELPGHAGQLGEPGPHRGPEDGRVRDLRRARPGAGRALPAGRQRRQHHRVLAGLHRVRPGPAADARLPGGRGGADRDRRAGAPADHHRHRDPDRQPRVLGAGARRPGRVRRGDRRGDRPGDPLGVPAAGPVGGGLRRAGLGRGRRRAADRRAGARADRGLHGHRQRAQGPGLGDLRGPGPGHRAGRRGRGRRLPRPGL